MVLSRESAAIVSSNSQWGGRFAEGPSAVMRAINASVGFDRALWRQDIRGSLAHAAMLAHVGIISAEDEAAIQRGLADVKAGRTKPARQVFARLRRKHGIPR